MCGIMESIKVVSKLLSPTVVVHGLVCNGFSLLHVAIYDIVLVSMWLSTPKLSLK